MVMVGAMVEFRGRQQNIGDIARLVKKHELAFSSVP